MAKSSAFRQASKAANRVSTAWARFYHWGQIGHRSDYSVERLLAFQNYYETTSISRVIAVCLLTPIPAILVYVLIDCIPLRDPSEGWKANYAFWVRDFLDLVVISAGGAAQAQAVMMAGALSNTGIVTVSLGTAVIYISMTIAVAATWRFPVPFGCILFVGPYVAIATVLTISVIGPRVIASFTIIYGQLKAEAWIVFALGAVAMAYPIFTAIFYQLSGIEQTAFVLLLPVIKFIAKALIAHAADGLHEYVSMTVVFSVDVFNVLYIAICMQISKSTLTTVVMISLDLFHVILGVRAIFSQIDISRERRMSSHASGMSPTNCFQEVSAMMAKLLREPQAYKTINPRIRVFAPFSLSLSPAGAVLLLELATASGATTTYLPLPPMAAVPPMQLKSSSNTQGLSPTGSLLCSPKVNQIAPANYAVVRTGKVRKGSSPRRLLRLLDSNAAISADKVRAALSYNATEAAVYDVLQALFHAEYLLLAEYIECALPLLYSVYLLVLSQLPAARYYPQTSIPFHKLAGSVANILLFTLIEFAGFASLLVLLRRKFGVSPLYQLAFILETHA